MGQLYSQLATAQRCLGQGKKVSTTRTPTLLPDGRLLRIQGGCSTHWHPCSSHTRALAFRGSWWRVRNIVLEARRNQPAKVEWQTLDRGVCTALLQEVCQV